MLQCSQCKEYFLGTPTNGHQCYRQMQVDLEYCHDPNSQTDCLHDPVALLPGRTVFYAVQPKYLNVDIRITIDVTQGGGALGSDRSCVETTLVGSRDKKWGILGSLDVKTEVILKGVPGWRLGGLVGLEVKTKMILKMPPLDLALRSRQK